MVQIQEELKQEKKTNKILIGSRAIKYHFPDFREPKDYDYLIFDKSAVEQTTDSNVKTEFLVNPIFKDYPLLIMLPNDLYTLKISHLFWDINWDKHMYDTMFLRDKGCVFNRELFDKLYTHWSEYHGKQKKSNLTLPTEVFFQNAINYKLDHDLLHTFIHPEPAYLLITKNDGTVATDDEKFDALSDEDKSRIVTEECRVMAAERLNRRDYRVVHKWMYKKLILNHLPLEQALFAIFNYRELHLPTYDYVSVINKEMVLRNLEPIPVNG